MGLVIGDHSLHRLDDRTELLAHRIFDYVLERIRMSPPPLDGPRSPTELQAEAGTTITTQGLGYDEAFRVFREVLAPACISSDHPRFLSFVPSAPSEASTLFDLVVSASSICGDWWLEGAGAIHAENEALRWLGSLAGFPEGAGGTFVSGGTLGNLAALATARETWRHHHGRETRPLAIVAASSAHSSVRLAAKVLDVQVVTVPSTDRSRLQGDALRAVVERVQAEGELQPFAVVTSGGATNTGIVDDLTGAAAVAADHGLWMHVDAAYGGAALCSSIGRPLLAGIEAADSFVIDPHKWLFSPFDCAALVYRHPGFARAALTQHAEYLETLDATAEWNASDFAVHMSRRVRGLPFWFSLASHGTDAYDRAVSHGILLARTAAEMIRATPGLELVMEPELSVVLFRKHGWTQPQYQAWSDDLLSRGLALVVPTVYDGEAVLRFCFVNPLTTTDDVQMVLDALT